MLTRLKQYTLIGIAIAAFYFLLSHHFIVFNYNDFEILKKQELSMEYTFFSPKQTQPMAILQIDVLRDAGIEDILLDRGLVSEARLDQILDRIDNMKEKERQ
jgi:hypothetical protein